MRFTHNADAGPRLEGQLRPLVRQALTSGAGLSWLLGWVSARCETPLRGRGADEIEWWTARLSRGLSREVAGHLGRPAAAAETAVAASSSSGDRW